ncbi:MAG: oligopeptide:H+ symporter [Endozoicomonadaceae bacterium]|nr:oligopeptide:H+ symporter [Endozoicomonadaceae bacterium]
MNKKFNIFIQPKPFYMIFLLEFWERFGFYGLQAVLVIYFVKKLGYSESHADMVYGAFSSLVFGMVVFGGKLGDMWLGTKRMIILGAVVLGLGYLILGISDYYHKDLFFIGLGTVAVGNGLFKANPSNLLSRCYERNDPRLDGAFSMYYMAINLGSIFSLAFTPYLVHKYNWYVGFFVCAGGLLLGFLSYLTMRSGVTHIGSPPDQLKFPVFRFLVTVVGAVVSIIISSWLLMHLFFAHLVMYCIGVYIALLYIFEIKRLTGNELRQMILFLILMLEGLVFFIIYIIVFTAVNLFTISNVEHSILGISVVPESFLSLDSLWVVILGPVLGGLFNYLGKYNRDLSMPLKFAIGMVLCVCAFLALLFGIAFADQAGIVSSGWLILFYAFFAAGEILISALGLSMITKLVPKRSRGFSMGAWFMMPAFASIIGGYIATFAAAPDAKMTALQRLPLYHNTFFYIALITAVIAVMMLFSTKYLLRLISEKSSN